MSDQPVHDLYENMDDEAKATAARNASAVEAALRVHQHVTACITERHCEDLCRQKLHNMLKTFGASTPLSAEPTEEELKRRRHSMKCLEMTLVGVLEAEVFTDVVFIDKDMLWPRHQAADEGMSSATRNESPFDAFLGANLTLMNGALMSLVADRQWLEQAIDMLFWNFVQAYTEHPKGAILSDETMAIIDSPLRELQMHLDYEQIKLLQAVFGFATLMEGQARTVQRLEDKLRLKSREAGL